MFQILLILIILTGLSACHTQALFDPSTTSETPAQQSPTPPVDKPGTSEKPAPSATAGTTLRSLSFSKSRYDRLESEGPFSITLSATFSKGDSLSHVSADVVQKSADCDLTFSSSNMGIARVTTAGVVSPQGVGAANLTARCGKIAANAVLVIQPDGAPVQAIACNLGAKEDSERITSIVVKTDPSRWRVSESRALVADVELNTALIEGVSESFVTPNGSLCTLDWSNSDPDFFDIIEGHARLFRYGKASLKASLAGVTGEKEIEPLMPTTPYLISESFLGPDDHVSWILQGKYGGFGAHLFPQVTYGPPEDGGLDVVSFGVGGKLKIELHGYLVVDGEGPDFTVFENAFGYGKGKVYAEAARVGVSQDDKTYFFYDCAIDYTNHIYTNCAGVTPTSFDGADERSFLNPTSSGGDSFDLAEFGLPWIRYIMIEDMTRIGDVDPLTAAAGKAGFDLDAVGIVNGLDEKDVGRYSVQ